MERCRKEGINRLHINALVISTNLAHLIKMKKVNQHHRNIT